VWCRKAVSTMPRSFHALPYAIVDEHGNENWDFDFGLMRSEQGNAPDWGLFCANCRSFFSAVEKYPSSKATLWQDGRNFHVDLAKTIQDLWDWRTRSLFTRVYRGYKKDNPFYLSLPDKNLRGEDSAYNFVGATSIVESFVSIREVAEREKLSIKGSLEQEKQQLTRSSKAYVSWLRTSEWLKALIRTTVDDLVAKDLQAVEVMNDTAITAPEYQGKPYHRIKVVNLPLDIDVTRSASSPDPMLYFYQKQSLLMRPVVARRCEAISLPA
jgi:hypothetical protein